MNIKRISDNAVVSAVFVTPKDNLWGGFRPFLLYITKRSSYARNKALDSERYSVYI